MRASPLRPEDSTPVGRFAPSPTGPLHLGSLVAAVGSFLFARAARGRWLLRMEDLDTPRVMPGAADEIARSLERYGLEWDGSIVRQSDRGALYLEALAELARRGLTYPCACSRRELLESASAPVLGGNEETGNEAGGAGERVYPGTCRNGLGEGRRARAIRFRLAIGDIDFEDAVHGGLKEDTEHEVGDFVVQRADGVIAYQLAVVVDDGAQGVTQVVRGADLLSSTARQIHLQRALGLATPAYAHLPLVLGADGKKLGKRDGALPLASLAEGEIRATLAQALRILGQTVVEGSPREMLMAAVERFEPGRISVESVRLD